MILALGIFAGILLFLYSLYFIRIIKGKPQDFEIELLKSMTQWMVQQGRSSKGQLWAMYFFSVLLELTYFILVLLVIKNPFIQFFTALLAGVETFHLASTAVSFRRFFAGQTMISQLFNWGMERMSAILFFTHSLLVLVTLLFF
ncbi:Uncharacterized [Syntrophomonas zehnderi OL-4]|uniref:Uncharacterized n=1 Tax=Syntrophomonas zehnderi OL-4 TaxID=690567 RepID=A0A0E4C967_9FIRM|nr:hypothetical protein [Syntrophomonas zehnderi]CFX85052.1 Uncharacterized [Syntrophomonas zehnderi OL-4]